MTSRNVIYFVEGECEEALVRSLINDFGILASGRIRKLNLSQKRFPKSLYPSLKYGMCAVFIFDTDVGNPDMAIENINMIRSATSGIDLIVIPQGRNMEEELCRACGLRDVRKITKSRSNSDFKRDFLRAGNIRKLLDDNGFDFSRLWIPGPDDEWRTCRIGNMNSIITNRRFRR